MPAILSGCGQPASVLASCNGTARALQALCLHCRRTPVLRAAFNGPDAVPRPQQAAQLSGGSSPLAWGYPSSSTNCSSSSTAWQQGRRNIVQPVGAGPPSASSSGEGQPARLAVFVSGGGSNFKAIHAAMLEGRFAAEVVAVVSDVPGCGGWQYAEGHGIPTLIYPTPKKGGHTGLTPAELVTALQQELKVDYVILAGYLKLIPEELVRAYHRAMLNIHPGLLPAFGGHGMYGQRVHKAVIASGARFSGPTVHFVDAEYDTGPILAQRVVPVLPTDSPAQLAARVLKEEHKVYPEAVAALCEGRITWREDGIPILWSAH